MGSITMEAPFTLKDTPIENLRPMKVRCIGAGFSGIYAGVRIPRRIQNVDFQIYEKNDGVGGTWWENRYPGCACDVPAHSYQYAFEPNPDWSEFHASAPEIRQYLHYVAEKYGVLKVLKTKHKVLQCDWDEAAKKWKLRVEKTDTGEVFDDDADVIISARGTLNEPKWPVVPGIDTFKGALMHSAAWDETYDFKNKRIGVIGGGSSAVQILPNLQQVEGAKISHFVRSKVWIANPFFDELMAELGLDPAVMSFSDEKRHRLATDPDYYLKFRKTIEGLGAAYHAFTFKGSDMQIATVDTLQKLMKERLASKPEIADHLIPSFAAGCRRLIPGLGYLESLTEPNVDFYYDQIASINTTGIQMRNGDQLDLDVIICATGFNTSGVPAFPVTGKEGETLQKKFQPYPETYMSLAVDNFPNYFIMCGPNALLGAGSLTSVLEAKGDYITKCIRKLQKEDYLSMMPKRERVKDFSAYVEEYFKKTIYTDDCNSWYKNKGGVGDRVIGLWPGSTSHALEMLRSPRWEDFEYESVDDNRLRWLGNGWSVCQTGGGDPTWYLDPTVVDIPTVGAEESDSKHGARVFSH